MDDEEQPVEEPAEDEERRAYIARHGGYWGDAVSTGGVWVPVPGPDRPQRG